MAVSESTEPPPAAATPPPEPTVRVGRLRAWHLRRQGRLDGRHRRPEALELSAPVRTAMRLVLHHAYDCAAAEAYTAFADATVSPTTRLVGLVARAQSLRKRLSAAEADLVEADSSRPDRQAAPERRAGEQRHPDDLIRLRREREHAKRSSAPREAQRRLRDELDGVQEQIARIRASVNALHRQATGRVVGHRAQFGAELAVYHQALVRRHPDGDLLSFWLDSTTPLLPGWTYRPPFPTEED